LFIHYPWNIYKTIILPQLVSVHLRIFCTEHYLIINVGEVAHICNFIPQELKISTLDQGPIRK
jgi:hypothetical protein